MDGKILEKATELFMHEGFKVVTMDEIAASMGISKKTIYRHYANKNILVEKSARSIAEKILDKIDLIFSEQINPIEELFRVRNEIAELFTDQKTAGLQQLKKYYPEIHAKLKNSQRAKMEVCFQKSIERGIKLGLYRADIDIWFIEKLHRNAMSFLMEDEVVHKDAKSFTEYQNKYLDYHIRAIGTEKGIELLNELKQKLHEN